MMHKFFAATLAASLIFSTTAPVAYAEVATQPTVVLKKKKLKPVEDIAKLEAMKADLQMKIDAARKAAAAKPLVKTAAAGSAKPVIKTTSIMVKKKPVIKASAAQTAIKPPCGSFLQCVFGHKRNRAINASIGQVPAGAVGGNMVLSGKTSHKAVAWTETKYPVGALIVKTPERALYYVSGKGEAIRYSVGVGREGMQWSGVSKIVAKAEWPAWNPPKVMIDREALKGHFIPTHMDGGPGNPLGARAMYIGGRMYRVHGTNNEASIGGAVSSGCIRMMNADVIDLYERVKIGAPIYVYQ